MAVRSASIFLLMVLAAVFLAAAPARASTGQIPYPAELQKDVDFWIRVYSEISTSEGFLHDSRDLSIVYRKLAFEPDITPRQRRDAVDAERKKIEAMLRRLASGTGNLSADEKRIKEAFGDDARPARFREAAGDVRFQLGQSDRFRQGLERSGIWEGHIATTFARMGLPPELAALPHVESSFDPTAYSKVGAAGMWQFMPATGKLYLRIDDAVDERMDPFRATEAAAQLLQFNHNLLGSWPLALTAYNHGAAGMRRARDAMGTTDIAVIARNYKSRTFGFASRNFYVSFLAALTIDRNPEEYFPGVKRRPEMTFTEVEMPAYMPVEALQKALQVDRQVLASLNPALMPPVWSGQQYVPQGYRLRLPAQMSVTSQQLAQRVDAAEQFPSQPRPRLYVVRSGDTLSGVAARHNLRIAELASLNGLSSKAMLKIGQQLRLPQDMAVARAASAEPAAPAAPAAEATATAAASASAPPSAATAATQPAPPQPAVPAAAPATEEPVVVTRATPSTRAPARAALAAINPQVSRTPAPERVAATLEARRAEARAVAESNRVAEEAEPVSEAEALATSPALAPGAPVASATDAIDYSVAADGTIRVAAEETLGHFADWLGVSASSLRSLNKLSARAGVPQGRRLKLDFSNTSREQFEQRRRGYHEGLQAEFFAGHRIVGTLVYVARSGDSLWNIAHRHGTLPTWLVMHYNPDIDFDALRSGQQVIVPRVEVVPAA